MADISSIIANFNKELDKAIDRAMQDDVFGAVRDIAMPQAVQEKVYDAYTPKVYVRRKTEDGGLQDPHEFLSTYDSALHLLEVENDSRGTQFPTDYIDDTDSNGATGYMNPADWWGRNITPIVESGNGYIFCSPGPRPFVHYAQELMMNNNLFASMLNYGLAASGFDVS